MKRSILATAALLMLLLPNLAFAAIEVSPPTFGFDGSMFANRTSCITLQVESDADPFQGAAIVTSEYSGTPIERRVVPFTVTPGIPTNVTILTTPYSSFGWAGDRHKYTIQIRAQSGARIERFTFSSHPSTTEVQLNPPLPKTMPVLLVCGSIPGSLLDASDDARSDSSSVEVENADLETEPEETDPWELSEAEREELRKLYAAGATEIRCTPLGLPRLYEAYEAVDAVVIDSCTLSMLEQAQRDALLRWTRLGGLLVVLLDCDDSPELADLPELAPLLIPSGFKALRSHFVRMPDHLSSWSRVVIEGVPTFGTHLGLGRLTVIDKKSATESARITSVSFWQGVLTPILSITEFDNEYRYYPSYNQANWPAQSLFPATLALHGDVPVPPFWPLAVALGIFAIIIGPLLALMIRRRPIARFSWVISVFIIAAASVGSWIYPDLVRSQNSWSASATLIDAAIPPNESTPPVVAQSSLLILGSGATNRHKPDPALAGRWRVVHAPTSETPASALPVAQSLSHDLLDAIPARVWQIKPLLYESGLTPPEHTLPECTYTRHQPEIATAQLRAPEGMTIIKARLVTSLSKYVDLVPSDDQSVWSTQLFSLQSDRRDGSSTWDGALDESYVPPDQFYYYYYGYYEDHEYAPPSLCFGSFNDIPSVVARTRSIRATLKSGRAVLMIVEATDDRPRLQIEGVGEYKSSTLYRILIPVAENQQGVTR